MASINGHPPLPFLLDTGSEAPVYLADWAAKSLGLSLNKAAWQPAKPDFHLLLADTGITSVNSIKLIGIDKHNNFKFAGLYTALVGTLDDSFVFQIGGKQERIAGLIGSSLLSAPRLPLTIDFDRQRITMTLGPPSPVEKGAVVIPLKQRRGSAFNVFYVPVPAAGSSDEMLLDTGADSTAISPQMLRAATPLAQTIDENTTVIGDFVSDNYLVAGLTVGGCRQTNIAVSLWSTNYFGKPALLGLNFLSRYLVTLDFSRNRLILMPRTGLPAIYTPFGMTLARQDSKYRVTDVADDFPADRLGVRIDDELTAINRQSVEGLASGDVLRSLTRLPEDRITLSFRRRTGAFEATFDVADRAAFPHPATTGLILLHTSAASLSVDDVVPGSPCAVAGLRKGDVLLQVNDIPVQRFYTGTDASSPDIRAELEKADVTLAVWRPSAQASFTYPLSSRSPDVTGPMVPRQPAKPPPPETPSPPGIPSLFGP